MVLDQILIEKLAKKYFLTFDLRLNNIDRLFILDVGSVYSDVTAYQISMSCHVQFLRYNQLYVQNVSWQSGCHKLPSGIM